MAEDLFHIILAKYQLDFGPTNFSLYRMKFRVIHFGKKELKNDENDIIHQI